MKPIRLTTAIVSLSISFSAFGSGAVLSDPNASTVAKNVYAFLASRAGSNTNRVLEGQHLGGINEIVDPNQFQINAYAVNNKLPALVGSRYDSNNKNAAGSPYTLSAALDQQINNKLIGIWNTNHSIIHLTAVAPNPWSFQSGRLPSDSDGTLSELLRTAPASAAKTSFWNSIDIIAAGLQQLEDANVPVLFRPFPEFNQSKYYCDGKDSIGFKNLWIDVYNYYVNTKGLHNLIFCWEAWVLNKAPAYSNIKPWYPGDAYVDVVAGAYYFSYDKTYFDTNGALVFPGVNDKTIHDALLSFKKPYGSTQWGLNQNEPNNTPGDNTFTLKFINNVPSFSFVYYWTGYQEVQLQANGTIFVNDPAICTADDLPNFNSDAGIRMPNSGNITAIAAIHRKSKDVITIDFYNPLIETEFRLISINGAISRIPVSAGGSQIIMEKEKYHLHNGFYIFEMKSKSGLMRGSLFLTF